MAQKKTSNLDKHKNKKQNYSVKNSDNKTIKHVTHIDNSEEETEYQSIEKKSDNEIINHIKKYKLYYIPVLIIILTLLAYIKAFDNDFVNWDDDRYVTLNPYITEFSWENIKYFFSNFYFVMYIPLTMVSYMIDYSFVGLSNPSFYHIHNILIHSINSVLVFFLVLMIIKKISKEKAFFYALISALLFAIHPMHIQSVSWIAERKDVLYSMFYLASLILYMIYIQNNKMKFYFIALFLFLLSLFSKTQAVTLSISMVLIDYLIGRIDLSKENIKRFFSEKKFFNERVINEKIPFFILSSFFGLLAIFAIGGQEPLAESFSTVNTSGNESYPFYENVLYSCYSFTHYVIKLFIPYNLSAIHPFPQKLDNVIPLKYWLYPIPVLALIATTIWAFIKNKKIIVFSILFFTANIILVLQLASVQNFLISEHYAYIPAISLSILLVYFHFKLLSKFNNLKPVLNTFWVLYIAILTIFSFYRNDVWQNSSTLWDDVIKKYPEVIVSHYNRGNYYQEQGDFAAAEGDNENAVKYYSEAIKDYTNTLELNPSNIGGLSNRGITLAKTGNPAAAVVDFNKVVKIDSTYGNVFSNLGNALIMLNKWDSAIINYTKALKLKPDFDDAHYNRGTAYNSVGKYTEAIADFTLLINKSDEFNKLFIMRAMSYYYLSDFDNSLLDIENYLKYFQTDYLPYYFRILIYRQQNKNDLANADIEIIKNKFPDRITNILTDGANYELKGDYTGQQSYYLQAKEIYNIAFLINPQSVECLIKLGVLNGKLNSLSDAIKFLNQALEIDANNSEALTNRGFAKDLSGNKAGAIEDYTKAISINDKAILAYFNRGIVYNLTGKYQLALADFTKAIEIEPNYNLAYLNRGISYIKLNNSELACSDWQNSLNLGNSQASYYLNLYCK